MKSATCGGGEVFARIADKAEDPRKGADAVRLVAAIKDLQTTTTIAGHPLAEPKAVWIALWDNEVRLRYGYFITCTGVVKDAKSG